MGYSGKLDYVEYQTKTPTMQTFFAFKVFYFTFKNLG